MTNETCSGVGVDVIFADPRLVAAVVDRITFNASPDRCSAKTVLQRPDPDRYLGVQGASNRPTFRLQ